MRGITLLGLCAAALTMGFVATMSLADDEPFDPTKPVFGFTHELSNALFGAYAGSGTFTVEGDTYQVTSRGQPLALLPYLDTRGSRSGLTTTVRDLTNTDSITTEDQQIVIPTLTPGYYIETGLGQIIRGTGKFLGATGWIGTNGLIHVEGSTAERISYLDGRIRY